MGIRENIIKLRELFDVTQEQLGAIAGVTRGAVSQWEGGFSEPRMGAIQKMSDYFHISKSNIIEDGGMDLIDPVTKRPKGIVPGAKAAKGVKTARVPLVGRAHAGPACEPVVYEGADDWVEIPETYLAIDPECFVMDFEGDCMLPDFGSATSLVISPNSPFGNGSIVVAVVDEVDYVVRRIYQSAKELRLKASNPAYDDIVIPRDSERTVAYKGKALGCFRRFD